MDCLDEFEYELGGFIPVIICLTYFDVQEPMSNPSTDLEFYGYQDIEFEVYSRRGRKIPECMEMFVEEDKKEIISIIMDRYRKDMKDFMESSYDF